MCPQLVVAVVVEAFDRCLFDRAGHALDLAAPRENSPPDCFLRGSERSHRGHAPDPGRQAASGDDLCPDRADPSAAAHPKGGGGLRPAGGALGGDADHQRKRLPRREPALAAGADPELRRRCRFGRVVGDGAAGGAVLPRSGDPAIPRQDRVGAGRGRAAGQPALPDVSGGFGDRLLPQPDGPVELHRRRYHFLAARLGRDHRRKRVVPVPCAAGDDADGDPSGHGDARGTTGRRISVRLPW